MDRHRAAHKLSALGFPMHTVTLAQGIEPLQVVAHTQVHIHVEHYHQVSAVLPPPIPLRRRLWAFAQHTQQRRDATPPPPRHILAPDNVIRITSPPQQDPDLDRHNSDSDSTIMTLASDGEMEILLGLEGAETPPLLADGYRSS